MDVEKRFIDWTFVPKKEPGVDKSKLGKGSKVMAVANRDGVPLSVGTGTAFPHEVTLVKPTLQGGTKILPCYLIGDKAHDGERGLNATGTSR